MMIHPAGNIITRIIIELHELNMNILLHGNSWTILTTVYECTYGHFELKYCNNIYDFSSTITFSFSL